MTMPDLAEVHKSAEYIQTFPHRDFDGWDIDKWRVATERLARFALSVLDAPGMTAERLAEIQKWEPTEPPMTVCGELIAEVLRLRGKSGDNAGNPDPQPGQFGEPWCIVTGVNNPDDAWVNVENQLGELVLYDYDKQQNLPVRVATYERIVACVNACAGVSTGQLERSKIVGVVMPPFGESLALMTRGPTVAFSPFGPAPVFPMGQWPNDSVEIPRKTTEPVGEFERRFGYEPKTLGTPVSTENPHYHAWRELSQPRSWDSGLPGSGAKPDTVGTAVSGSTPQPDGTHLVDVAIDPPATRRNPPQPAEACETCRFFSQFKSTTDPQASPNAGYCRIRSRQHFPVMELSDWCGEYQPKGGRE